MFINRIIQRDCPFSPFIVRKTNVIGTAAVLGGAAISALGSIAGGISSTLLNYKNTKKLTQMQQEWQEKMRDEANAYNTPSAQMQRYKEAGINPYLALGNVDSGQSDTVSGSVAQAPDTSALANGFASASQTIGQIPMQLAQLENIQASTDDTKASAQGKLIANDVALASKYWQIASSQEDYRSKMYNASMQKKQLQLFSDTFDMQKLQVEHQTETMLYAKELQRLQVTGQGITNAINRFVLENQLPQELANLGQQFLQLVATTKVAEAQYGLTKAETHKALVQAKTALMDSLTNRMNAQTNQMVGTSQANNLDSSTNLNYQQSAVNGSTLEKSIEKLNKELDSQIKQFEQQNFLLSRGDYAYKYRQGWLHNQGWTGSLNGSVGPVSGSYSW